MVTEAIYDYCCAVSLTNSIGTENYSTRANERGELIASRHTNKYGLRKMDALLPTIINKLPADLIQTESIFTLKVKLRQYLISGGTAYECCAKV